MDDSTDSFGGSNNTFSSSAFTNDTNAFSNSVFTSDTNYYNSSFTGDTNACSNSALTSDTNAYSNPAFTSDTNDNCNFVDSNSRINIQDECNNTIRDTHSTTFPSETNTTQCMVDDSSKIHAQNEADVNHRPRAVIRHSTFEEDPKNSAPKGFDYTIDFLITKEDCNVGESEGSIRHKIQNDKSNNICKEIPKECQEKKGLYCLNNKETYNEQTTKSQCNLQTDLPSISNESTSYGLMKVLDQGLQETAENVETDKETKEYNKNKYSKDSTFHFNNYGPSQINLAAEPKRNERFAPHWKQFMAAMGPYLMIFSGGLSCGFSATLLPQLKLEQSVMLVDDSSPSWIASMAALPMAPGCFIGGWIIEKWGRRYALRVLSIPFFFGWILIATAPSLSLMLMGRFLNGISIGMLAPPMSVFISETSHPKLRGMFLAFLSFSLAVGIFVAHLIGTWVSWSWTATICSIFPLVSAGLLTFVPESPMWLLSKGRNEEATNAFYWLRGHEDEVITEFNGIMDKLKSADTKPLESWKDKLKTFYSPEFFKPLVIMVIIYVTCQFSGVHTITFYSVTIIEIAVGKGINKYTAMLTIDFLRVVTTVLTIMTSRKFPRRSLCLVSGTLTTISMMSLALFLYIYKEIPESLTAVPLCFLSAYIIAINIGLMPLPWIIVGEIFPARVRSFGAGLASAIGYSSTFIVVKSAPGMMVDIGQVATFMFYGSVALVGTTVLYFVLPETKGRSMVEIEALFKRSKIKNDPS